MSSPKKSQVVDDMHLKTQFHFAGALRASYGNMDQDEIYVVDPSTKEAIGKPREGVEYSMLRSGLNRLTCKFYPNAMVTKQADDLLREFGQMSGKRDWYDVTMLVRAEGLAENVHSLQTVARSGGKGNSLPENHTANVISLFTREPQ